MRKVVLKWSVVVLVFVLLTLLTQVGGILLVLSGTITTILARKLQNRRLKISLHLAGYFLLYILVSICIIPPLAKLYGRVPLPVRSSSLQPRHIATVLCNRHYVTPTLLSSIQQVKCRISKKTLN